MRVLVLSSLAVLLVVSLVAAQQHAKVQGSAKDPVTQQEVLLPTQPLPAEAAIPVTQGVPADMPLTTSTPPRGAPIARNYRLVWDFDLVVDPRSGAADANKVIVHIFQSIDGAPFREVLQSTPGATMLPIRVENLGKKHCWYGIPQVGVDTQEASETLCDIPQPIPKLKRLRLVAE